MTTTTPESTVENEVEFILALNMDQVATRDFAVNLVNWSSNTQNRGKSLRLNINSMGGNYLDCIFLFEEVQRLRRKGHKVHLAAYGRAASCSAWFLQGGDKRIIGVNSWLLVHEISSRAEGTVSQVRAELARMEQLQDHSIKLLTSRSKLTAEMIRKNIDGGRDWWIDANTAKELGLVDEVEDIPPFA